MTGPSDLHGQPSEWDGIGLPRRIRSWEEAGVGMAWAAKQKERRRARPLLSGGRRFRGECRETAGGLISLERNLRVVKKNGNL